MAQALFFFFTISFLLLSFGMCSYLLKRKRLLEIQRIFVAYNDSEDLAVITNWIKEKHSGLRMLNALDYLLKIEREDLALEIYNSFDLDAFPNRHIRIFACKAFKNQEREREAILLAERLLETYPKDDSILDLFIDVQLTFGKLETAKLFLSPRIEKRFKGTIFARHYARLLAAEGDYGKAVTIMENVVSRERTLFKNSYAEPQKSLIFAQFEESRQFLDSFKEAAEKQTSAT